MSVADGGDGTTGDCVVVCGCVAGIGGIFLVLFFRFCVGASCRKQSVGVVLGSDTKRTANTSSNSLLYSSTLSSGLGCGGALELHLLGRIGFSGSWWVKRDLKDTPIMAQANKLVGLKVC